MDGVDSYTCECDLAWAGWNCSIYTGYCLFGKSPCKNGAECVDVSEKEYECRCTQFFTGKGKGVDFLT